MSSSRFPILRGDDAQQSRVQDNVSALVAPLAKALLATPIMGAAPPSWFSPTPLLALTLLAGYAPLGVQIDALGYVRIRGAVVSAAGVGAAAVAFVLPLALRPGFEHNFAVERTGGTFQSVTVRPNGDVLMNLAIAAGGYTTFDGITYLAGG